MIKKNIVVIVGLICIWQLVVYVFQLPGYLLPGPLEVFSTIWSSRALLCIQAWPTIIETLVGLFFGVLWATGIAEGFVNGLQKVFLFLFDSSWSGGFWTNTLFVIFIALAIALVLGWNPFKGGMNWYMKLK